MDEKDNSGKESSENESFNDPELMSLINDMKNAIDEEDEIIELTDVIDVAGVVNPVENEQDVVMKDLEEDMCSDEYVKDDFAASMGMKIDNELDSQDCLSEDKGLDLETESQEEYGKLAVSPQQVEAAVERVVHRILGDKIDSILIEVIERAVTQEINRLKNILRVTENDFD
ncbi:MAG: hypothetical protein FP814_06815 [Desulfobacterium sp.]|nr:hypothetical protein [Desulfobacterium sp.]MBU3947176.1 hypothetical protein [Pseudomonadota bacterium]MBU4009828.1 hypothetical protein [Pseudomonadota bacterium]MBU4036221.1 hypothetical protein [Pseudomonadota bacterium]